jgi:hypothetical protein
MLLFAARGRVCTGILPIRSCCTRFGGLLFVAAAGLARAEQRRSRAASSSAQNIDHD